MYVYAYDNNEVLYVYEANNFTKFYQCTKFDYVVGPQVLLIIMSSFMCRTQNRITRHHVISKCLSKRSLVHKIKCLNTFA